MVFVTTMRSWARGAKVEFRQRHFQQLLAFLVERTELFNLLRRDAVVGVAELSRWMARISSECSPVPPPAITLYLTAGTSTWMSMRSSNGPEILLGYFVIMFDEQRYSGFGSPQEPNGHGWWAVTNLRIPNPVLVRFPRGSANPDFT